MFLIVACGCSGPTSRGSASLGAREKLRAMLAQEPGEGGGEHVLWGWSPAGVQELSGHLDEIRELAGDPTIPAREQAIACAFFVEFSPPTARKVKSDLWYSEAMRLGPWWDVLSARRDGKGLAACQVAYATLFKVAKEHEEPALVREFVTLRTDGAEGEGHVYDVVQVMERNPRAFALSLIPDYEAGNRDGVCISMGKLSNLKFFAEDDPELRSRIKDLASRVKDWEPSIEKAIMTKEISWLLGN
ncbi:MAG: hypothetical protein IT207_01485 [Fimbriimonadaceae bacterium]|nr:hypothetical protein [Fimbriimonadaceae bacterium]